MTRIIGLTIARNEELYLARAVRNALPFCDEYILLDHESTDNTINIMGQIAREHPNKVRAHPIHDLEESHEYLRAHCDTDTWIFGVDGDEIYDPVGLLDLRQEILAGRHGEAWRIRGNYLHAHTLDLAAGVARGWLGPPSHQVSKLYNLHSMTDWPQDGGHAIFQPKRPAFKPGFSRRTCVRLCDEYDWDDAYFRCLHLRFLPRTRAEIGTDCLAHPRVNMSVVMRSKTEQDRHAYKLGGEVEKPVACFFPEIRHGA